MPSDKNLVTVACVNFKPAGGDKQGALERIAEFTNQAGRQGQTSFFFRNWHSPPCHRMN